MLKGHPIGLLVASLANMGERFGYYTMLAIFLLFVQAKFGFSAATTGQFYAIFLAAVYFMPVFGGMLADKIGFDKCVITGVSIMFAGYVLLAIPTAASTLGMVMMIAALLLIALGTGLFKGNLQVLVGNLYDDPKYAANRDSAFSLFYMAINIGAMFAPSAATAITNYFLGQNGLTYNANVPPLAHQLLNGTITPENSSKLAEIAASMNNSGDLSTFASFYLEKLATAYNLGFAVACVSLIFSITIYLTCRKTLTGTAAKKADKESASQNAAAPELTPAQTKERMVALFMVFAVVIFFWMAFHQNGSSLTFFARDYTESQVSGPLKAGFNIWILAILAAAVYTIFAFIKATAAKGRIIFGLATLALLGGAYALFAGMAESIHILPQEFQQFNPFFVVALTPISMAIFGALAKKNKEPSAPKKIGLGMFVAALGYLVMMVASMGLMAPSELNGTVSPQLVTPTYLISTYLVLTFAELLLSPMGISFVSKVAPPKYKGMMMGFWFAATAIGNYLSSIPSLLWNNVPLWVNWTILMALCVISGLVMFAMLKKLEAATNS